ncbi:MAG TPA: ABC transporter ATP-binding protein [Chiayiivirga sp.]|nr:ABC transporter ATP-binding protein [Chiayiivirga sp.]
MIEATNLSKTWGRLHAVDRVSFRVEPGQVLGFLGPNGAGKSTTMKMIAGFLEPSAGTARVCGFDVREQSIEARRALGYLSEGAPSYGEMTVRGFLDFVANVRDLRDAQRRQRLDDVIGRLQLESVLAQSIETLSKGFRRRVGLAQAILHDPRALILDEPTDGLDPNQKHEVRGLIQSMAAERTIIISTHILEEVHAVCSRAIIIAAGRILADATPAELEARSRFHGAVSLLAAEPLALKDALTRIEGVAQVEFDPPSGRITVFPRAGQTIFPRVDAFLRSQNVQVSGIELERGRLDEVFRDITAGKHTKEAA